MLERGIYMKKLNLIILAIFITLLGTSFVNSFYSSKKNSNGVIEDKIEYVEVEKEKVLFLGDSITDLYNLNKH